MATRSTPPSKTPKPSFSVPAARKEVADAIAEIGPFTVDLGDGEPPVQLIALQEANWLDATSIGPDTPALFARTLVREEDFERFMAAGLSMGVMEALVTAWREHYGVDADAGNSGA